MGIFLSPVLLRSELLHSLCMPQLFSLPLPAHNISR